MDDSDQRSDSTADGTDRVSNTSNAAGEQSDRGADGLSVSRRGALASVVGLWGLSATTGTGAAQQGRGPQWQRDVDANGNRLFDLGALAMRANTTDITDFEGSGLSIDSNGVLTVADPRTNVSDDGTQVVADTTDINFASNLSVTDDGDGSVTVEGASSLWEDADSDNLLEAPSHNGIDVGFVKTPRFGTTSNTALEGVVNDERFLLVEPTATGPASNIVGGHPSNSVGSSVEGATIAGGGQSGTPNKVTANYGFVGGGDNNEAKGELSTVCGGLANEASLERSTIGGGSSNVAGDRATVAGGDNNEAAGIRSTIGGGQDNEIQIGADDATVGGGNTNVASEGATTIGGGSGNTASGLAATVAGGDDNTAGDPKATVGGGRLNEAAAKQSTVAGGKENVAGISNATVGGGFGNEARGAGATIAGGGRERPEPKSTPRNVVYDSFGTIGGGDGNQAGSDDGDETSAEFATVGGGQHNAAKASHATIGGGGSTDGNADTGNVVVDEYGTIGGGSDNQAGSVPDPDAGAEDKFATVGGGEGNTASARNTTIGGGSGNTASARDATVGGGLDNEATDFGATVGGGGGNKAMDVAATVAGGENNTIDEGLQATIGGGGGNTVIGNYGTVGGGVINTAEGQHATVPGGSQNRANGVGSFAAGKVAKAADDNTFVWNDDTAYHDFPEDDDTDPNGLSSAKQVGGFTAPPTGANTFHASATGGFRFITGSATSPNVTYIQGDSAGWANTSTRTAKTNIDPVDSSEVLAGVEEMEVATWEYKDGDGGGQGVRHIGPMAEDFHEAVEVGDSDEHINSVNADGVAFAAIQGLSQKLEEKDDRIDDLEAENEQLRERLEAVEDRLDRLGAGDPPSTAADD